MKVISIETAYSKSTCVNIASTKRICIRDIYLCNVCIKTVYISNISAIKYLEIHLELSEIFKIRSFDKG